VRPLADHLCVPDGAGAAAHDAQAPVADLVAVAVGTVQDVARPPLAQPRDVGQLVAQTCGQEQAPG
jgi:hypothetical protein